MVPTTIPNPSKQESTDYRRYVEQLKQYYTQFLYCGKPLTKIAAAAKLAALKNCRNSD